MTYLLFFINVAGIVAEFWTAKVTFYVNANAKETTRADYDGKPWLKLGQPAALALDRGADRYGLRCWLPTVVHSRPRHHGKLERAILLAKVGYLTAGMIFLLHFSLLPFHAVPVGTGFQPLYNGFFYDWTL